MNYANEETWKMFVYERRDSNYKIIYGMKLDIPYTLAEKTFFGITNSWIYDSVPTSKTKLLQNEISCHKGPSAGLIEKINNILSESFVKQTKSLKCPKC